MNRYGLAFLLALASCVGYDYGKTPGSSATADADGDGYPSDVDCDDENAAVFPGASERCNGLDDDCSGAVDDLGDGEAWYATDGDGDGYGSEDSKLATMHAGSGSSGIYPSDEGGSGIVEEPTVETGLPADTDGVEEDEECPDGAVDNNSDCDDTVAAVNPGAQEVCDDADTDEDCDGTVDDADSEVDGQRTSYADADGDGYGDDAMAVTSCDVAAAAVSTGGDCDDADSGVFPGATEHCDGVDEDCDNDADNNPSALPGDLETCYVPNTADESCTADRQCADDPDSGCLSYEVCMAYFGPTVDPSEGLPGIGK